MRLAFFLLAALAFVLAAQPAEAQRALGRRAAAAPAERITPGGRRAALAVERGQASFYATRFHGRRTASGERYDHGAMTVAHRTLPFGTRLRITNERNGRTIEVRVNDRGPHVRGRIVDLSGEAARRLGVGGTAPVQIEVLDGRGRAPAAAPAPTAPRRDTSEARPERAPLPIYPARPRHV